MVLTKAELIGSLQNEVRILLHLAGKVDAKSVDYRPTAKQRSTRSDDTCGENHDAILYRSIDACRQPGCSMSGWFARVGTEAFRGRASTVKKR